MIRGGPSEEGGAWRRSAESVGQGRRSTRSVAERTHKLIGAMASLWISVPTPLVVKISNSNE